MFTSLRRAVALTAATLAAVPLTALGATPAAAADKTCSSATPASSRPLLRLGDTGSCVTTLQKALASRGWTVNTDGVFNTTTLHAVRRFQASWQYLQIDGIVGAKSWDKLVSGGSGDYSTSRGPNRTSKVMLTYDDCPRSLSAFKETVLAAEQQGIRLALFPYGDCKAWGKIDYAFARSHGHYVFNHSTTHPKLTSLSYSGVLREIDGGPSGTYLRPPYGASNVTVKNAAAAKGMRLWLWGVDTEDWRGKSQGEVVRHVVDHATAGSTVLMHMQHAGFNGSALRQMKSGLAAKGLSVCRNDGPVGLYPNTLDC